MNLVETKKEILENLIRFNQYKISKNEVHRNFYTTRLKLGRNFVYAIINNEYIFCPSRVVGYLNFTAEEHIEYRYKNGSITTPRINKILGDHDVKKNIESKYLKLCKSLNIIPSEKPRTYWSAGRIERSDTFTEDGENSESTTEYHEGLAKQVNLTRYERDLKARDACIKKFGFNCYVCQFNFQSVYGNIGKGFIHVHHLEPISNKAGRKHTVDPENDLRPVCPNCHAMLHKSNPPITIKKLISTIKKQIVMQHD